MTLGRCPLSIFCSRETPPVEPTNPESITYGKAHCFGRCHLPSQPFLLPNRPLYLRGVALCPATTPAIAAFSTTYSAANSDVFPATPGKNRRWHPCRTRQRPFQNRFFKNRGGAVERFGNYFTEMCSGSEAGSYLRLIAFVYHTTLGLRVIKKEKIWHT